MGCISSRSTNSSHQNRLANRRIQDGFIERSERPLELNVLCHQSFYLPTSGLRPANSGEYLRSYPTITQRSLQPNPARPRFGEYRCICGRTWSSRLSWQGNYQICKRCKRTVHPHTQRELRPSDISTGKETIEHPKELCQKCQQLGSYCGKQNIKPRQQLSRHTSMWTC